VEITEHRCAFDPGGIIRALTKLSQAGVRLSLDDFGTGDSTLARLRGMQFDELKIDRCFVYGVANDSTDRNIVRFVTELGHSLGSIVVAEGIETNQALRALCELGVDAGQGYFLHRPDPPT
jgi:EAL domain-containing protein (putative c-di-GMP-specific phosphodiesterase class I)